MVELICSRCGRKVNASRGIYTTWFGRYAPPKFFCNRCIKKMEKEEKAKKPDELREIRELGKQISRELEPTKVMMEVLRDYCPVDGWYKLMDINERFRVKVGWKQHDVRSTSHILNKLGFTRRARKKHGSYMHVFISAELLRRLVEGDR